MLHEENVRFRRKHSGDTFLLHVDNSRCHNKERSLPKLNSVDLPEFRTHLIIWIGVLAISGSLI
jgi:hypothetical protein